jgi:hypothetical protein
MPPTQLPSPPATVSIASLNVSAEVDSVASSGGILGVPDDPSRLGWWTGGAAAGSPHGSVILDGHVDSAATGPGALFRLGELAAGDRIVVTTRSGAIVSYAVTARRVYPKSGSLPAAVFDQRGPARLVLISCGGPFDRSAGSYLDNIVVFAVPG